MVTLLLIIILLPLALLSLVVFRQVFALLALLAVMGSALVYGLYLITTYWSHGGSMFVMLVLIFTGLGLLPSLFPKLNKKLF